MIVHDGGDGTRPVVIDDSLFYPLFILVISMLLVPFAVGMLFNFVADIARLDVTQPDVATLRTGVSLIAQGVALVGMTVRRVTSGRGLGLPVRALGLPASPWRSSLTRPVRWGPELAVGVVAGVGITALNIVGSWLTQRLFALFMDEESLAQYIARESGSVAEALGGGASAWIVLLLPVVAVVVAPVAEEVFFRGYLYAVLRSRFLKEPWYALYWSSAVFALVHFYVIHFIPVFLIGLALGYLYRVRRNLVAPVVAHATTNLVVTVATLVSQSVT